MSNSDTFTVAGTVLTQALQRSLKEQAAREALTDAEFRALDVRVDSDFDLNHMGLRLRITWRDPYDVRSVNGLTRCIDHIIATPITAGLTRVAEEADDVMKNISLRGELFFFRLAKHFPKHLKKIECDGAGGLKVEFKNGRLLHCPETDIETTEFLAKCGMIYDL